MKKAFITSIIREIAKSMSRFLSIFAIVAIGVAFYAGIRASGPDMQVTADKYLDRQSMEDLRVLSKTGFTQKDVEKVKNLEGVLGVMPGYSFDALAVNGESERAVKVHSLSDSDANDSINKPLLLEGSLPAAGDECVTEKRYMQSEKLKIGDYIELRTGNAAKKLKITGIVSSPLYILGYDRGSNTLGNGTTEAFFEIGEEPAFELAMPRIALPAGIETVKRYTELTVTVKGAKDKNSFLQEYDDIVEPVKTRIIDTGSEVSPDGWYVLGRDANYGYVSYSQDVERIKAIGKVFPLIFFLVAALVSLTTMTRMVEEQRTQIGTLKAIGYSKTSIVFRYFIYAFSASIAGSVVGFSAGFKLLPKLIITCYKIMYAVPSVYTPFNKELAITSTLVAVVCTTTAAMFACMKELNAVPAVLMRPRSPKTGKRILLERIGFIWRKLSFTKKVTARNLMRYKNRFFMSIIGIAGCTALLLTGFGLKDSIASITGKQFDEIYNYNVRGYFKDSISENNADSLAVELSCVDGIKKLIMSFEKNIEISKPDSSKSNMNAYLLVPYDKDGISDFIKFRKDGRTIGLSDDGVILTEKLAKKLGARVGDNVRVSVGDKTVDARVGAITEHYISHYIYMSPGYYKSLFGETARFNEFIGQLADSSVDLENTAAKELMKNDKVKSVNFITSVSSNFKKTMNSMNYVVMVLIASAAALAFVVMFNLTSININERIRELATIKVLGFYNLELAEYVYRENMLLTLIGILGGLVMGVFLHRYVIITTEVDMVMFVRQMRPLSFVYSALLTIVFSGFVNIVMYGRLRKINMVESLKSVE